MAVPSVWNAHEDFTAVRAVISLNLTSHDVSDETIASEHFVGEAWRQVLERITDAASKTGDDLIKVRRALVLITAAQLIHSVVNLSSLSSSGRDRNYNREPFDPDARKEDLLGRADSILADLEEADTADDRAPIIFTVAAKRTSF